MQYIALFEEIKIKHLIICVMLVLYYTILTLEQIVIFHVTRELCQHTFDTHKLCSGRTGTDFPSALVLGPNFIYIHSHSYIYKLSFQTATYL